MIQKIRNEEYLKRFSNMTLAEKNEYTARVGEWLERKAPLLAKKMEQQEASYQNPLQMGMMWNDAECSAWHEGVTLMSALMNTADTWLPDVLYNKAAKRGIRQMIKLLKAVIIAGEIKSIQFIGTNPSEHKEPSALKDALTKEPDRFLQPTGEKIGGKPVYTVSNGHIAGGDKDRQEKVMPVGQGAIPARPKHIDQYVHLLPKKTQERAGLVRQLLRDLDAARENARLLAMAGEKADKIAAWAKTSTAIDEKLKSIYKELDSEWDRLVKEGCVGVDALGNAFITEKGQTAIETAKKEAPKRGRKPMTEEEKAAAQEKRAAVREAKQKENDAKRMEALKKNLRDTRTNATPERKKQWKDNLKVLLALGGKITDSIRKAAEHYEIDISDIENAENNKK